MVDKTKDESIKDRILSLLEKGYARSQLINDFGFAERTADAAIRAYKKLGNEVAGSSNENDREITGEEELKSSSKPIVKGVSGNSSREGSLAVRKEKESVLPEWLEADVAEIFDGQTHNQKIFLAGMSVPLMGLRLLTEAVKPVIDLLTTWQQGQAQAAIDAQESGIEVAHAAAEEAAQKVREQVQEELRQGRGASSSNPVASMVTHAVEPYFTQALGRLFGMLGGIGQPPGTIVDQPGQSPPQNPPQGGTSASTPGTGQASDQEIKEVFGDD